MENEEVQEDLSDKELLGMYDCYFADFISHDFYIINDYFNRLKVINELWRVLKRKERKLLLKSARISFVTQVLQHLSKESKRASYIAKNTPEYQNRISNKNNK